MTVSVYKTFEMPDGSTRKVRFTGKTKKEAEKKKAEAIREYERGLFLPDGSITVARYAEEYLQRRKRTADEQRRLRQHLVANIGRLQMRAVKPVHIERCFETVPGSSQNQINKTWRAMYHFFRHAVNNDVLQRNPLDRVERPRGTDGKRRALSEEEQAAFLAAVADMMTGERKATALFFAIIYGCGLRPGEVMALSRSSIIERGEDMFINVTGAVKTDGSIGQPKTAAGVREVYVPPWLASYVRQYLRQLGSLFLFPGTPQTIGRRTVNNRWQKVLALMAEKAGQERHGHLAVSAKISGQITPYYLRHTYRTNLAEIGVNPLVSAYWMGHSDAAVNDIGYAHLTKRMIAEAVETVKKAGTQQEHYTHKSPATI